MSNRLLTCVLTASLCAVLCALPTSVEAAQVVGATAASPTSVPVGAATPVTVTAVITDGTLIASSVNVQRLDEAGRVVATLGTLVDSGTNGDQTAGDKVFTLRVTVLETSPTAVRLRVSAAFQGKLTRVYSPVVLVNAVGTSTGITISAPANLAYVNTSPVRVSGTVGDGAGGVTVNGVPAAMSAGGFTVSVPLQEGTNTLTAVAANSNGSTTTASVQVTLDTTPPHVTISAPADQAQTTAAAVAVSGMVNDIVVGTVNDQQAQVTVNNFAAQVANRSFLVASVGLNLGPNLIHVVATDRSGNQATTEITVTRIAPTTATIRVVSGSGQTGPVGTQLPQPLIAAVQNDQGQPVSGVPVVFQVTDNSGGLVSGSAALGTFAVTTNGAGQAAVPFKLGTRAGVGNNIIEATAAGFAGPAVFTESGTAGTPAQIVVDTGNGQIGAVDTALPLPFIAIVTDDGHNRLAGVPVSFTVKQGGGKFAGQPTVTTLSDGDGRVAATLTLGLQEGQDNNVVEASFAGNTGNPAAFLATARVPGNPALTKITGVVLNNSNAPIAGVTMRVFRTHSGPGIPEQVTPPVLTDAAGTFTILPAPVGTFKLMADGSTATSGTYPPLEFDITTVAGQNNDVGLPIYLPNLDTVNRLCVDEVTGGTLTLPQVPGFALTILPGSATFPGGARSGCVTVTPVNGDKVPMAPGFGQQPRFVVTIQPVGTLFNPPAALSLPNVDGLLPRQVTEMYSYDHDLASFVAIGTGTVSEDGLVIRSDPGVGVLKAGWHCGGNPNPTGVAATCPECAKCVGTNCVPDPAVTSCDSGNGCCLNGLCSALPGAPPAANGDATLTHTLSGVSNPGTNFGLTVVTIGQQGVTGPTFSVAAFRDGTNWVFRANSISHNYLVGTNGQGRIDITGPNDPKITAAQPGCPAPCTATRDAVIADLTPPAPGAGTGPPRGTYWSSSITAAHEQCHVDRFYTDARFWPKFMKMFEDSVEGERIPVRCDSPPANTAASILASRQAAWQTQVNNFHGQADAAEIGGSEVACHDVSNALYTTLIAAIPR